VKIRIIGEGWHKKAGEPHASKYNQFSKEQIPIKESHHLASLEPAVILEKLTPVLI
jgi:pyrimidine deaminase RibD-like protein